MTCSRCLLCARLPWFIQDAIPSELIYHCVGNGNKIEKQNAFFLLMLISASDWFQPISSSHGNEVRWTNEVWWRGDAYVVSKNWWLTPASPRNSFSADNSPCACVAYFYAFSCSILFVHEELNRYLTWMKRFNMMTTLVDKDENG